MRCSAFRVPLATFILISSASFTSHAQSALTDAQRKEYARQFATPREATSKELTILRDIQQKQTAIPAAKSRLAEYINLSPAIIALKAGQTPTLGHLMFWTDIALKATSIDHTTNDPANPPPTFAEQFGPARSSRAMAIVHLSIFEAVNTITRKFKSYKNAQDTIVAGAGIPISQISSGTASVNRAILEAAYASLLALYPHKKYLFDQARLEDLPLIGDPDAVNQVGKTVGQLAARAILDLRKNDGSDRPDLSADDFNSGNPLDWHKDPISLLKPALGGNWNRVLPFAIASADAFRPLPPPTLGSPEFIKAFKDVKRLGGDPKAPTVPPRWPTQTDRTGLDPAAPLDASNESFKAIFWAYDGTALLCAPPRLYNMIATSIALKERPIQSVEDMARFLALINVAMADAGIGAWEAKYHYVLARPVTAIRGLDADSTPEGKKDARWTPFGAPVTNGQVGNRNLTPPFPAYPSGHAVFGGALFQTFRNFWSLPADGVPFQFISDEFNGVNRGPGDAKPRPLVTRTFQSFTEAEAENAQSRIWLGIHWQFDADRGIEQGRKIADDVYSKILQPGP
jgi:hypothetical protein